MKTVFFSIFHNNHDKMIVVWDTLLNKVKHYYSLFIILYIILITYFTFFPQRKDSEKKLKNICKNYKGILTSCSLTTI